MSKPFRFRLQKLLRLRQTELEQLESKAALALQQALAAKRRQGELRGQLEGLGERRSEMAWLVLQAGAEGLFAELERTLQAIDRHEGEWRAWSQRAAQKRTAVEALATLRQRQHEEHRTVEQRRADQNLQEQILRQWTHEAHARPLDDAGSLNHG